MTTEALAQHSSKDTISTLVSRNITTNGRRTSVRLEPEMWTAINDICRRERASIHEVCTAVSRHKGKNTSLTAAIRVFIMAYFRAASTEEGHTKAGHGQGIITLALAPLAHGNGAQASLAARQTQAGIHAAIPIRS